MASEDNPTGVAEAVMTSRMRISALARQSWAETGASEGDDNSLWISANSMWSSINNRYSIGQARGEDFEVDLHDLWFIYYHAAMNVSSASPNQDRLVVQILQAREQGALVRCRLDGNTIDTASTADGVIWTDLPYLVPDMTSFWIKGCGSMSAAQRLNLASFLAKLASISLVHDKLCVLALVILRDSLEDPKIARLFGRP